MQTSDAHSDPSHTSREGTLRATPIPPLDFDIMNEIELLHRHQSWQTGISLKKLVRYPDFRISLTAMKANTRIEMHQNLGRISVQTVDGHIWMHAADKTFDLPKGRVLVLDRAVPHNVEALVDSAFLLTVARREMTPSEQ
jgi:quercetin dioxygenase-like cupin family protein